MRTYVTPDIVGSEISTTYETNESGSIHDVASSNDEVVEVWTCQSYNSIHTILCSGIRAVY